VMEVIWSLFVFQPPSQSAWAADIDPALAITLLLLQPPLVRPTPRRPAAFQ
jgi:hypothetical protein